MFEQCVNHTVIHDHNWASWCSAFAVVLLHGAPSVSERQDSSSDGQLLAVHCGQQGNQGGAVPVN